MNLRVILDISRTHLLARIKQSVIAALGVTFGIGTFIILVSFMTGLNGMLDGLVMNRTPHIRIYQESEPSAVQPAEAFFPQSFNVIRSIKPRQSANRVRNALPIIDALSKDPRVKGVTAQVDAQVFYLSGIIELNGLVHGVDILEQVRLFHMADYIVEGSATDLANNSRGIILGIGVGQKMSVEIGDRIQVMSARGDLVALTVVGFYQSGLADVDDVHSYVNLPMAQRLRGEPKSFITDVNVKLNNMEEAFSMSKEIGAMYSVKAVDIRTANAQYETGTSVRNLITYAVSITLLIVAGFGIYNILNMLIYEKMNDIAILKATGFSGSDVRNIFITQALVIGVAGGILGLIGGYLVSVVIDNTPFITAALPFITTYPVNFDSEYYLIGIVFALVTTFFAGYLPARKASKIDPVDIIRGQ